MRHANVTVSGTVQGVGFRFTTRNIAQKFDVGGTVQNLSDGRVRLEAEGTDGELDAFFAAIKRSRIGSGIRRWEEERGPATGMGPGFDIRPDG